MRTLQRLLLLGLVVAVLVFGWRFAAENAEAVSVAIPFWTQVKEVALWKVLLGVLALGVGLGVAASAYPLLRASLLARRYRKVAAGLEAELHQLRNLPLAGDKEQAPRGSAGQAPEWAE